MPSPRRLELVVPGLLGPVTDADAVARLGLDLPILGRLLARARLRVDPDADGEGALLRPFGIAGPPWPTAAAARAGEVDDADPGERWWLRADPVHLRVDTTHARLFGAHALDLSVDETAALVARLNEFFAADGLAFEAPAPDRWYLGFERAFDLDTHAPERVAGRNVDPFLPTGADARAWRSWLNEVQMLLHDAPLNAQRERRGALPVNSVWLWGGGIAPAAGTAPAHVWSDEPVTRGLARRAGVAWQRRPDGPGEVAFEPGTSLLVESGLVGPLVHGDIEGWLERLARLDRIWLSSLLERLRHGRLDRLDIVPGDGRRFTVTRVDLRRFWRRPRPWTRWLKEEP